MNQKLKSIQDIVISLEKDRELSFTNFSKILVKTFLTQDNFKVVKEKYLGIDDILKGVQLFTSFKNRNRDYIFKMNLYKKETSKFKIFIKNYFWNYPEDVDFYTIILIKNGKEFIESLFQYIDLIKFESIDLLAENIQKNRVNEIIKNAKNFYGKNTFTFEIPVKKYFGESIEYYKIIKGYKDLAIRNISIFDGLIKFSVHILNNGDEIEQGKIIWEEKNGFLIFNFGSKEKKFKKGKNTYFILKESIKRNINECIDFIEMIELIEGRKNLKEQDKFKMIYNAVSYANSEIENELGIKEFFGVEEKAYKRLVEVYKK